MKSGTLLKSARLTSVVVSACLSLVIFDYQNCSKVQFTAQAADGSLGSPVLDNPMCNRASRPAELEYVACPAPNMSTLRGIQ